MAAAGSARAAAIAGKVAATSPVTAPATTPTAMLSKSMEGVHTFTAQTMTTARTPTAAPAASPPRPMASPSIVSSHQIDALLAPTARRSAISDRRACTERCIATGR